jgi:protein-S-isoprenylcysteine O-methyltransferase Ste14
VTLCTGGVYRVVRHPYYLSSYLIDSSFCLLSGNHLLLLLYPFLFFWSYRPTMRKEDKLLAERYGDAFTTYRREVPEVFPDRSSFKHLATLFEGFSKERITWKECARVSRFCSLGIFLTLMHDVAGNGLSNFHLQSPVLRDWGELLFALLATILYVASFVFAKKADRNGRGTDSTVG